ncbi:MAG: S16 family serine protease, partial [Ilumatobacteraceae bacterium]
VEADGVAIRTLADLSPVIAEQSPGDTITLVIQRGDETVSAEVELIAAPDEPERTIIGFMPVDTTTLRMPDGVTVDFDTGGIGGPSAGLAFTLSLLDAVTAGDLTGGIEIAVTGAIDPDGNVGAIGGLSAKAEAVRQMGVRYFLVPASQPAEGFDSIAAAQAAVGDEVQLIPVATLDEALQVLEELGGDALTDGVG